MILINRHTLSNGLPVIHHKDTTTAMVAVNVLYNVGARDEAPDITGFAHLFEHLMFGGSVNIPNFDGPIQLAGAENNAWTSNDVTNYYEVLPAKNIETAFWLESDRMLGLNFSQKSLDIQKQVVVEEFKQRNLNQPYGDVYALIRELAYKVHPYRWQTIGVTPKHIEEATLEQVKDFFFRFYAPNNAVLCVAGNVDFDTVVRLAEKWFLPIPNRLIAKKNIPQEPIQTEARFLKVQRDVPSNAIYKAYHMCDKLHPDYAVCDLLSDLLANGNSSRLIQSLVHKEQLFSEINAYISGDIDAGLFHIHGKPKTGVSFDQADKAIQGVIDKLISMPIDTYEMEKVKNKFESNFLFSTLNYQNKATDLAFYELLHQAEDINLEVQKYRAVTQKQVQSVGVRLFQKNNCSTLYYEAKK